MASPSSVRNSADLWKETKLQTPGFASAQKDTGVRSTTWAGVSALIGLCSALLGYALGRTRASRKLHDHAGRWSLATVSAEQGVQHQQGSLADKVRDDFPLLKEEAYPSTPLVYFDSAATSQKPQVVIDAMDNYYRTQNSNVHRGVHAMAAKATDAYEGARAKLAAFIKAPGGVSEIVFTRGATEAINLVAQTWGLQEMKEGDEIIVSVMEHHANLVPWQMLQERTGCVLKFVQLDANQGYDLAHFRTLLSDRTKLVALPHVSNTLGCICPVKEVVEAAHAVGACVLLDACQSVPHMPVDVGDLGVDWLVASGHKMCGPTGIGFLWGRYSILEKMPPWQGGGEMIDEVFLDHSTWAPAPGRFEAGTPAIAEAIGLGAACDYLTEIGMDKVQQYEHDLGEYLWKQMKTVEGLDMYGPPPSVGRAALVSFNDKQGGSHALDLSTFLDLDGVAVRSGHHCTQPLHRELGVGSSARASLYIYNTFEEVDKFIEVLKSSLAMLRS